MGLIFEAFTTVAGWIAFMLEACCIAAGLYIACDVVEENITLAKRILWWGIGIMCAVNVALWLDGDIPFRHTLIGLACHLSYIPLLLHPHFPHADLLSVETVVAGLATLLNHVNWFLYFLKRYAPPLSLVGFFLVFVWFVPLGFFVSLTVGDETASKDTTRRIHGGPGTSDSTTTSSFQGASMGGTTKKRRGLFKSFVDSTLDAV